MGATSDGVNNYLNKVGIEIEFKYSSGSKDLRLNNYLVSRIVNNIPNNSGIPTSLLHCSVDTLNKDICKLFTAPLRHFLYRSVHMDGGNIETSLKVLKIASMEDVDMTLKLLECIIEMANIFNVVDYPLSGVHINIPLEVIDTHTLKNICWLYYRANGLITTISNRYDHGQNMVDLRGTIGDYLGIKEESDLHNEFLFSKDTLLDNFNEPTTIRYLSNTNIFIHKVSRLSSSARLEFRWFYNTRKATDILAYAQLVTSMISYCSTVEDTNSINEYNYVNYVLNNRLSYIELYKLIYDKFPIYRVISQE